MLDLQSTLKLPSLACLMFLMTACAEFGSAGYDTVTGLPEPEPQFTPPQHVEKSEPARKRFAHLEADDDDDPSAASTNPVVAGGSSLGGSGGSGLSSQGSGSWDG